MYATREVPGTRRVVVQERQQPNYRDLTQWRGRRIDALQSSELEHLLIANIRDMERTHLAEARRALNTLDIVYVTDIPTLAEKIADIMQQNRCDFRAALNLILNPRIRRQLEAPPVNRGVQARSTWVTDPSLFREGPAVTRGGRQVPGRR